MRTCAPSGDEIAGQARVLSVGRAFNCLTEVFSTPPLAGEPLERRQAAAKAQLVERSACFAQLLGSRRRILRKPIGQEQPDSSAVEQQSGVVRGAQRACPVATGSAVPSLPGPVHPQVQLVPGATERVE